MSQVYRAYARNHMRDLFEGDGSPDHERIVQRYLEDLDDAEARASRNEDLCEEDGCPDNR